MTAVILARSHIGHAQPKKNTFKIETNGKGLPRPQCALRPQPTQIMLVAEMMLP
jgi:hypothetical protein